MILKVKESQLFTTDPAVRFADTYHVSEDIWREIWKRYNILDYTVDELCEVFYIKVGTPINRRTMSNWIFRGRVYSKIHHLVKEGAQAVNSEIFGDLEQRVLEELFKHVKSGDANSLRTLA